MDYFIIINLFQWWLYTFDNSSVRTFAVGNLLIKNHVIFLIVVCHKMYYNKMEKQKVSQRQNRSKVQSQNGKQ